MANALNFFRKGDVGFIGWLGLLVEFRIWFRQEFDFREDAHPGPAPDGTIAYVMLAISAFRLNDDRWNVRSFTAGDAALAQMD